MALAPAKFAKMPPPGGVGNAVVEAAAKTLLPPPLVVVVVEAPKADLPADCVLPHEGVGALPHGDEGKALVPHAGGIVVV